LPLSPFLDAFEPSNAIRTAGENITRLRVVGVVRRTADDVERFLCDVLDDDGTEAALLA
jgi:RPA family protein